MTSLYPRQIEPRVAEALLDTPVVLLAGPRQAGKTTLVRQFAAQQELRYLILDDELTLLSAREDPVGLIRSLDRAVIDEIQRAPQLLLAIKKSVDEDRRPGRFLLIGSANLMTLPTVADSLAGRMETLSLLPLSQSELEGRSGNWIDSAFAGRLLGVDRPALGCSAVDFVGAVAGATPDHPERSAHRLRSRLAGVLHAAGPPVGDPALWWRQEQPEPRHQAGPADRQGAGHHRPRRRHDPGGAGCRAVPRKPSRLRHVQQPLKSEVVACPELSGKLCNGSPAIKWGMWFAK